MTVTPSTGSTATGFLTLTVDVELSDEQGQDEEIYGTEMGHDYAVLAQLVPDGSAGWSAGVIAWPTINRISGTATQGVWRGHVEVSPAWAGTYRVTHVQPFGGIVPVPDGPTFTVESPDPWILLPETTPTRIVTGRESYVPRALLKHARTDEPIAGWIVAHDPDGRLPPARVSSEPGIRLPRSGVWVGSARTVAEGLVALDAYGSRRTRGWSFETSGCGLPTVKWQANSRYSATSLSRGQQVSVTGNVWPAPTIYDRFRGPPTHLYLQRHAGGGRWDTVATSHVRDNGRYTLSWMPPAGNHELRVRKPGSAPEPCRSGSVGTNLISVFVTVR